MHPLLTFVMDLILGKFFLSVIVNVQLIIYHSIRIKMCTTVDDENFITVHHEMGHIEYYQAYSSQPAVFRNGANSAFHECIIN
jgi:hypothetical protein